MDVSRDRDRPSEDLDWDAAWVVAELRRPRYARVARAAAHTVVAVAVMATTVWLLIALVVEPFTQLGRPWL
jgi:hypothetical protein